MVHCKGTSWQFAIFVLVPMSLAFDGKSASEVSSDKNWRLLPGMIVVLGLTARIQDNRDVKMWFASL